VAQNAISSYPDFLDKTAGCGCLGGDAGDAIQQHVNQRVGISNPFGDLAKVLDPRLICNECLQWAKAAGGALYQ